VTPQVLVVDSTLVYTYRESEGRIVGCRRTLSGREMEPGLRTLVGGRVSPCIVSGPDSIGWKIVYKDHDGLESGVWLRSFNARTLEPASEPREVAGNDRCVVPQIAMGAGIHTLQRPVSPTIFGRER
jgi:hypothetical protein